METFLPSHPLLRKYIDSIYIFNRNDLPLRYYSYPSLNVAIGLFQNAEIIFSDKKIHIAPASEKNYIGLACNRCSGVLEVHYQQMVNEIAINFKPLGFLSFCKSAFGSNYVFSFSDWTPFLDDFFTAIFQDSNKDNRQKKIEQFLLDQYTPHYDAEMLHNAIGLSCDIEVSHTIENVAQILGVNYKYLYRSFKKNIGCSLAHFKKVSQFRSSLLTGLKEKNTASLTKIGYDNHYFDQSHFIKQMRNLSGQPPSSLMKDLTLMAAEQIAWKFM